jgi:ATP-dependent phosphofructokinase / diphosphate-dependent phosphofructokinase
VSSRRLGVLIGGGDCPGLNSALRAIVRRAACEDIQVLGIMNGWRGLIEGNIEPLTRSSIRGIQNRGGIILGTSRVNPLFDNLLLERIQGNWSKFGCDSLIVIGGDGTLSGAARMWREHGLPIVGIPATIDNDIPMTDYTIGFHTAVSVATEAIERLHTTAEARHEIVVTEVMGGHSGWIATYAGLAGSAHVILVPEHPFRMSRLCELLFHREKMGYAHSQVVIAEAAMPHPDENFLTTEQRERVSKERYQTGIGIAVAREIERLTGIMTRVSILGPMLMGGSPNAYDRILGTRFGLYAVEMVMQGAFGYMVAIRGEDMINVAFEDIADKIRPLNEKIYNQAEVFFA